MGDLRASTSGLPLLRIAAKDLPLARAAGAKVFSAERVHYVEDRDIVEAITVVRQIAYRTKKRPTDLMNRLADAGFVKAVGKFGRTGELDSFEVNQSLAVICGVTFTIGPIRCHPDGRIEIFVHSVANPDEDWMPVTDELLAALHTEMSLGAKRTQAHLAVEILAKWREQK
jgi:hypothetical protein